jgi:hypothetical protein
MSKEEYAAYYMAEKSMIREADHEVGMALGQLEAICDSAIELQEKIGTVEINLPGWIQDHISQSYNYIKQANDGYHVLDEKTISIDWEELDTFSYTKNGQDLILVFSVPSPPGGRVTALAGSYEIKVAGG